MTDRLPHLVLDALATAHWAISEDALRTMFAVAYRKAGDLEAIAAQLGRPLDHAYAVEVRDGVARLPIRGPMFRYANLFSLVSGATSYELIARDLTVAMQDPAVRAVVLDLDSPGGEVNGCAELAELIASYRGRKPLVAYVSGTGASAAYWLASACEEVVCADTAILGSLGVRMALLDTRARDRAAGVEEIEIVSSQTPRKRDDDPTTDTGRVAVQATVDALAAVFIAAVARYRGVPEASVLADYGQGGVFVGEAAVLAGLADRLGTYETLHAALAADAQRSSARPAFTALKETRMTEPAARRPDGPMAAFTEGAEVTSRVTRDVIVETGAAGRVTAVRQGTLYGVDFGAGATQWLAEDELAEATVAEPEAEPGDGEGGDAAPAARAHRLADLLARARTEGATAERERILGIEQLARPGLDALAAQAKADATCTPEAFARRALEHEAQTRRSHLAGLKADEAQLHAPAASARTPEGEGDAAQVQRILATHRAVHADRTPTQRTA
ncbi:MAG: S49 family peptidase [Gemmatimonadetes bacterium]|nr:S49 family peptidase [Gemmatimonadota bacterium]MBK7785909.1 S49 family peptidase [Gemmatimonadota bacterium]